MAKIAEAALARPRRSETMPPITGPADGPVAVTGASGYIGSHVVKNLVEHGYTVRATVRDASREDKTSYLLALNGQGEGSVEPVANCATNQK